MRVASPRHHWLIIACDACDTVIDLDLTLKQGAWACYNWSWKARSRSSIEYAFGG